LSPAFFIKNFIALYYLLVNNQFHGIACVAVFLRFAEKFGGIFVAIIYSTFNLKKINYGTRQS